MVGQLPKISAVKSNFEYIKDVYEVCLEKYYDHPKSLGAAMNSVNNGIKILQSEGEVDTYIAFYGAQHYYKLLEAFDVLDILRHYGQKLEIISYGCGAATDTCSLISYCRLKQINLPFIKLTLIDPSAIALERGIQYINRALLTEELDKIEIKRVNKFLGDLQESDLYSLSKIKLHIFSNILDLPEVNINKLVLLIRETQPGINYFVCISPKRYGGQQRIDDFYHKISTGSNVHHICRKDSPIRNKVWSMKKNRYISDYPIDRYHRIFMMQAS